MITNRPICRGSMMGSLNSGLDEEMLEANNFWKKRDNLNGVEAGLSMIKSDSKVHHGLKVILRCLETLQNN